MSTVVEDNHLELVKIAEFRVRISSNLPLKRKETSYCKSLVKGMVIAAIVIGLLVIYKIYFHTIFNKIKELLEHLAKKGGFMSFVVLGAVAFLMSILPIPGLMFMCVSASFLLQNLFWCFLSILISQFLAASFLMLIVRKCLKKRFLARYADSIIFRVLSEECRQNPWLCSITSNIVMLPACTKNYILPLTDLTLVQFYTPKLFFYTLFSYLFAKTGDSLEDISHLSSKRKPFLKRPII